jgi:hypothetical protein
MRRWSFIAGAILIILGIFSIFQVGLDALGVPFRIWWVFWPLVLIGLGLWIVTGFSRGGFSASPREKATVPLDGAQSASVTVHHGAGRLIIGAGAAEGELLSGSFGGGLDSSRSVDGGRLSVDMKVRDRVVSHYIFGPWNRGWVGALDWDFNLNPSLPLVLRLETGASESRLSLTDLQVRELHLKTGASSTTIDLPANAGFTRVRVESGAASVRLRVPQSVAAVIQVRSALAGIHVDASRFRRAGGGYSSADYETAKNKIEIDVETGVGSVEIY